MRALAAGAVAAPLRAYAQGTRAARVGLLGNRSAAPHAEAFRAGMRDLGWVEGRNLAIEDRWAEGRTDRLPALAEELVALNVDVIVAATTPAIQAAQRASPTMPVVMATSSDAVRTGLVGTLARPGGRTTGLTLLVAESSAKRLELLREIVPSVSRVGVLYSLAGPVGPLTLSDVRQGAHRLGVEIVAANVDDALQLDGAFAQLVRERIGALLLIDGPLLTSLNVRVAELASRHRLPSISAFRDYAEAGGLIAYGPDQADMFRRAAAFVDRILKGAAPGQIPVEQPTKLELVVNARTAKAIGYALPASLRLRADRIIE